MKLFNNTDTIQTIRIKDRSGMYYTVHVESKMSTDVEGYEVTDGVINKISQGLFLTDDKLVTDYINARRKELSQNAEDVILTESDVPAEVVDDEAEEGDVTTDEVTDTHADEPSESVFKCDICGNEYASSKGLEMHKSRSHK